MAKIAVVYYSLKGETITPGMKIVNLEKGHTAAAAEFIGQAVGGDLIELETVKSYNPDHMKMIYEAKEELDKGIRPALKECPDISEYDVIFLDFGIMVPGFFHLLEQCSNVYAVLDKSAMALRQRLQFETSMIKSGMEQLSGRIEYVTFSMAEEGMLEQEPVLHQWPYGILGDRARAVRCMKDGSGPEL